MKLGRKGEGGGMGEIGTREMISHPWGAYVTLVEEKLRRTSA